MNKRRRVFILGAATALAGAGVGSFTTMAVKDRTYVQSDLYEPVGSPSREMAVVYYSRSAGDFQRVDVGRREDHDVPGRRDVWPVLAHLSWHRPEVDDRALADERRFNGHRSLLSLLHLPASPPGGAGRFFRGVAEYRTDATNERLPFLACCYMTLRHSIAGQRRCASASASQRHSFADLAKSPQTLSACYSRPEDSIQRLEQQQGGFAH